MSLLGRFTGEDIDNDTDQTRIPAAQFVSMLMEYIDGTQTHATITTLYNLNATGQTELTAVINKIDALVGTAKKRAYVWRLEDIIALAEQKVNINGVDYALKADVNTRLNAIQSVIAAE